MPVTEPTGAPRAAAGRPPGGSPLRSALPAMAALQATVALGVFTLSVLAPQLDLSVGHLAALNTLMFAVGTVGALTAGRLIERVGDWQVAALCAAAVAVGMACLWFGGAVGLWLAVILFGFSFGPETPASASVLSRITPPARRPWVFSIRQTGNQLGAMTGSVMLPLLLAMHPQLPYLTVGMIAVAMTGWCLILSRDRRLARPAPLAEDGPGRHIPAKGQGQGQGGQGTPAATAGIAGSGIRLSLKRVRDSPALRALSVAMMCYTAAQMCMNTFLMSLAVREWGLGITAAAGWVAWLQAAGLCGRLFWGWRAQRTESAGRLLGLLGALIAVIGITLMAWPAARGAAGDSASSGLIAPVAFFGLLGFIASGWNGVMVAEVTRIAGPREAGALTGTVLVFGYAGITAAPFAFAALSELLSMGAAFMLIFAAAGLAGLMLLLTTPAPTAVDP